MLADPPGRCSAAVDERPELDARFPTTATTGSHRADRLGGPNREGATGRARLPPSHRAVNGFALHPTHPSPAGHILTPDRFAIRAALWLGGSLALPFFWASAGPSAQGRPKREGATGRAQLGGRGSRRATALSTSAPCTSPHRPAGHIPAPRPIGGPKRARKAETGRRNRIAPAGCQRLCLAPNAPSPLTSLPRTGLRFGPHCGSAGASPSRSAGRRRAQARKEGRTGKAKLGGRGSRRATALSTGALHPTHHRPAGHILTPDRFAIRPALWLGRSLALPLGRPKREGATGRARLPHRAANGFAWAIRNREGATGRARLPPSHRAVNGGTLHPTHHRPVGHILIPDRFAIRSALWLGRSLARPFYKLPYCGSAGASHSANAALWVGGSLALPSANAALSLASMGCDRVSIRTRYAREPRSHGTDRCPGRGALQRT